MASPKNHPEERDISWGGGGLFSSEQAIVPGVEQRVVPSSGGGLTGPRKDGPGASAAA